MKKATPAISCKGARSSYYKPDSFQSFNTSAPPCYTLLQNNPLHLGCYITHLASFLKSRQDLIEIR